ncbi:hypothetical protein N7462_005347, partial [Penicillium macrosclerotiorum]|uniref:uncharacterized protein n=1 Tax=Penicillium macrosclerotiorum TaxID=303699 RepID=UPI0025498AE6
ITWDKHSIFVRGERVMIFSGEFHPFRLPVPDLWLDVFQKIKSMGFTGVSFYVNWGLVEANPGHVITNGIWDLEKFFDAATQAGIYLIARPGPYINAETSAGGIPGWVLRTEPTIRSNDPSYLNNTINYMTTVGRIIEKAQITHGGPVIMVQPENEYSTWPGVTSFPTEMNRQYMDFVKKQLREVGITVPLIINDNEVMGYWAPGSGLGAGDIYGIDAYPLRYDCANPTTWPTYRFPYNWQVIHELESPNTPFTIAEFQGGSGGGWGGFVEEKCAELVNEEATFGGTNWGNLGYQGGYTSYDYGAAITEERGIWREKFSEQKLEANFLKVSEAYLTSTPGVGRNGSYGAPSSIAITPLLGNLTSSNFYVVRHADFTFTGKTHYNITLPTSTGNVSIPQLGGSLLLNGRDSKFHVTDYDVGGINIIYSSAEIFTWARGAGSMRVLILYGGEGETHEFAISDHLGVPNILQGSGVKINHLGNTWVIHWRVETERVVIRSSNLEIYLVWRNEAYNYWSLELPAPQPVGNFSSPSKDTVIVKAGYLIRHAQIFEDQLRLTGDINATTEIEVISTPYGNLQSISFNGRLLETTTKPTGKLSATVGYQAPRLEIPQLSNLEWRYIDSLPEIQLSYDDSVWKNCSNTLTNNPRELNTPNSLYAMDYGFHTGSLIYRGHFMASGKESYIWLNISGGTGFGYSVWLGADYLGSWTGNSVDQTSDQKFLISKSLAPLTRHVLTVLIDDMGQDEEAPGTDAIKFPKGILDYELSGHDQSEVVWKMTGNLGGEQYFDETRGPLNEGSMYAERQGYHYPKPPSSHWNISSPIKEGISKPGVRFYSTHFQLDIPVGWDVPMSIVFNGSNIENETTKNDGSNYRCQIFINGYQFGKYINNLGPQVSYPIPEGILNHNGINYIGLTLWSQDLTGSRLAGLDLVSTFTIKSGYSRPRPAPQPSWAARKGAY